MRRPDSTTLRLTTILVVALALLAPKASVALAALVPDGQRTVVLCTGTGLVRVTVGADGSVVDGADAAHAGVPLGDARHCELVAPARGELERRWTMIGRVPGLAAAAGPPRSAAPPAAPRAPTDPPPRGPPVGA